MQWFFEITSKVSRNPEIWIKEEYITRRKRNSAYSLRAFASQIEISVGQLSEIFSADDRKTCGPISGSSKRQTCS